VICKKRTDITLFSTVYASCMLRYTCLVLCCNQYHLGHTVAWQFYKKTNGRREFQKRHRILNRYPNNFLVITPSYHLAITKQERKEGTNLSLCKYMALAHSFSPLSSRPKEKREEICRQAVSPYYYDKIFFQP